jgi:hypothetical protein
MKTKLMVEFILLNELIDPFPQLNILRRDTARKEVLLYQHEGSLVGNANRIGNAAPNHAPFQAFFAKAKELNSELVMTPEYSCPLAVLQEVLLDVNKWPNRGKLWAICTESLTKEELIQVRQQLSADIFRLIFDESRLEDNNRYVDPLFYLFISPGNPDVLNVVIQFKSHPMSVQGPTIVERNHLIQGRVIYMLRNPAVSTKLISLICSEAMNFSTMLTAEIQQQIGWHDEPFFILNPMVNPKPAHPRFAAFRQFVLNSDKKQVIELNWNNRSIHGDDLLIEDSASRSGIFFNSNDVNQKDTARIRNNHKHGLYYFHSGANRYAFILNSVPHLFHLALPCISSIDVELVQKSSEGPEMIETYAFNGAQFDIIYPVDDGLLHFLNSKQCGVPFAIDPDGCVINKERLVCISSGLIDLKKPDDWYLPHKLSSFRLDSAEICRRFTVHPENNSYSLLQAKSYLRAVTVLNDEILVKDKYYPEGMETLKGKNIRLGYTNARVKNKLQAELDKYKYNLTTPNGDRITATVAFLDSTDERELNATFDALQALFEPDNNNRGRVIVYYTKGPGGNIEMKFDPTVANFLNTALYAGPSYLKDQDHG